MNDNDEHPPAATWLVPKLQGWANNMWMRFGGEGVEVYLVGSSLERPDPRDVDIAIVLPATMFALRYGAIEGDWPNPTSGEKWPPEMMRWARETAGLVPCLCASLASRLPPDLKVMATYGQEKNHAGKPRMRLDRFGSVRA